MSGVMTPRGSQTRTRPDSRSSADVQMTSPSSGTQIGPSIFNASSNMQVSGGQFTSQHGPTTVVVNIASDVGESPRPRYSTRPPNPQSNPFPSTHQNLAPTRITTPSPPRRSNALYQEHLSRKGRGHPLWFPEANRLLPVPYRKTGIRIGDVGIITPFGDFDFFFNICLSSDDPINPPDLPAEFEPLTPPLHRYDVREHREFAPGSYLASSSIRNTSGDTYGNTNGLIFESTASEGAVLTMPDGSFHHELGNINKFKAYAIKHAKSWYKFATGPRGREVQNGDIKLVTGCEKAASWGMAVFANTTQNPQSHTQLRFGALARRQGEDVDSGEIYGWEQTGSAEVRVGPDAAENSELLRSETNEHTGEPLINQCLFVRSLTISLGDAEFAKLNPKGQVLADEPRACMDQTQTSGSRLGQRSSTSHQSKMPHGVGQDSRRHGGKGVWRSTPRDSSIESSSSSSEGDSGEERLEDDQTTSVVNLDVEGPVVLEKSPLVSAPIHLSVVLNEALLRCFPDAKMVITSDKDWELLPENLISDLVSLPAEGLIDSINPIHSVVFENGIVSLSKREFSKGLSLETVLMLLDLDWTKPTTVSDYLFGPNNSVRDPAISLMCQHLSECQCGNICYDCDWILENGHLELKHHNRRLLPLDAILRALKDPSGVSDDSTDSLDKLRAALDISALSKEDNDVEIPMLRLGNSLLKEFQGCGDQSYLDEAIWIFHQVYDMLPPEHYRALEVAADLSTAHYRRWRLLALDSDLHETFQFLDAQLLHGTAAINMFVEKVQLELISESSEEQRYRSVSRPVSAGGRDELQELLDRMHQHVVQTDHSQLELTLPTNKNLHDQSPNSPEPSSSYNLVAPVNQTVELLFPHPTDGYSILPVLTMGFNHVVWDIRFPLPKHTLKSLLHTPATTPTLQVMDIVCPMLPWRLSIGPGDKERKYVSALDAFDGIYDFLRVNITREDWEGIQENERWKYSEAYERRYKQLSGMYLEREKAQGIKRVDFLLDRVWFTGLEPMDSESGNPLWKLHVGTSKGHSRDAEIREGLTFSMDSDSGKSILYASELQDDGRKIPSADTQPQWSWIKSQGRP